MKLIVTIMLLLLVGLLGVLYVELYLAVCIHEFGHYIFRMLFRVETDVFIGRSKHKRYIRVGNWWFSLLPFGGFNHRGSYYTLGPSLKGTICVIGGPLFSVLAFCSSIFLYRIHSIPFEITALFQYINLIGCLNLIPMVEVQGSFIPVFRDRKILATVECGRSISPTDGWWLLFMYRAHKNTELKARFDTVSENLRNKAKNPFAELALQRRTARNHGTHLHGNTGSSASD